VLAVRHLEGRLDSLSSQQLREHLRDLRNVSRTRHGEHLVEDYLCAAA
jgi:hypothetical protein